MKIIQGRVAGNGNVVEYDGDPVINLAQIDIRGRYPEKGWALNTLSKMICIVTEGPVAITTETETKMLNVADVCVIDSNEKYYWAAQGGSLIIAATPAWTKQQSRQIDDGTSEAGFM